MEGALEGFSSILLLGAMVGALASVLSVIVSNFRARKHEGPSETYSTSIVRESRESRALALEIARLRKELAESARRSADARTELLETVREGLRQSLSMREEAAKFLAMEIGKLYADR